MGTAVDRVDVVGKREDFLVVAVVVLDRNLDREVLLTSRFVEIDRLGMQNILVLVEMLDEFCDAAEVEKLMSLLSLGALIGNRDLDTLVEKGLLAQPL